MNILTFKGLLNSFLIIFRKTEHQGSWGWKGLKKIIQGHHVTNGREKMTCYS